MTIHDYDPHVRMSAISAAISLYCCTKRGGSGAGPTLDEVLEGLGNPENPFWQTIEQIALGLLGKYGN